MTERFEKALNGINCDIDVNEDHDRVYINSLENYDSEINLHSYDFYRAWDDFKQANNAMKYAGFYSCYDENETPNFANEGRWSLVFKK